MKLTRRAGLGLVAATAAALAFGAFCGDIRDLGFD